MYILKNWSFKVLSDSVKGICYGNPEVENGHVVVTSSITSISKSKEGYLVKTFSGSEYLLPFEDINPPFKEESSVVMQDYKVSLDVDKCITLWTTRVTKELESIKPHLKPNTLYIRVAGAHSVLVAWYRDSTGEIHLVRPMCNTALHVVSVRFGFHGMLDFRYFEHTSHIECYTWSEGLAHVLIENIGKEFEYHDRGTLLYPTGEIIELPRWSGI